MTGVPAVDVVVPTVGRPALADLLRALAREAGPPLGEVVVVDDRRDPRGPLPGVAGAGPGPRVRVVRGRAAGPAAARNLGWRSAASAWIAFLDDDVVPEPGWRPALARDLAGLPPEVAGSQGVIRVPRPEGRRPTDRERGVIGLEGARWATADMAYRRAALAAAGGFDERFPRAYREDADIALRLMDAGWRLVRGARRTLHPVAPGRPLDSVRAQAGNADDVLMRALHGRDWRRRAGAPRGRRARHLATAGMGLLAAAAAGAGRRPLAAAAAGAWLAGTGELAWARIAPGPRTPGEAATMAVTSALIPPAAAWHTARGLARRHRLLADRARAPRPSTGAARPRAVLLDRDGTLVVDVPYNGDPARVRPLPGVPEALERLRREGVPTAVVSNQSGIGRGLLTHDQVRRVNSRIERVLGPLGPWLVCPHAPGDGCACRKPAPGLVAEAARALGVPASACAMVGDIGADVEAALGAGARPVLVPTPRTRPEEVAAAPEVAPDLAAAIELLLGAPR